MKTTKRQKMKFTVRFYQGDQLKFTSTQAAFDAATAALMAEQMLFDLFPTARYDRYDIQWAA